MDWTRTVNPVTAYNNSGDLQALTCFAPMPGYTHQWTDDFRSTVASGNAHLQNDQSQGGAAHHETYYESANVIWQLRKWLSIGLECLYGYKAGNSCAHGDVWRVQTGKVYSLF